MLGEDEREGEGDDGADVRAVVGLGADVDDDRRAALLFPEDDSGVVVRVHIVFAGENGGLRGRLRDEFVFVIWGKACGRWNDPEIPHDRLDKLLLVDVRGRTEWVVHMPVVESTKEIFALG